MLLIPTLIWLQLICDISSCTAEAINRRNSTGLRKWLGVPPSLLDVALYWTKANLVPPFKSPISPHPTYLFLY